LFSGSRIRSPAPAIVAILVIALMLLLRQRVTPTDQEPSVGSRVSARIVQVIDGDTVELQDGTRLRLLGIDAPELARDDTEAEGGAEEAKQWLHEQIRGATVELRYGPERQDRYGRTLAWVYLDDGTLLNETLLQEGHARLVTSFGLPLDLSDRLHMAAAQARVQSRGIWSGAGVPR